MSRILCIPLLLLVVGCQSSSAGITDPYERREQLLNQRQQLQYRMPRNPSDAGGGIEALGIGVMLGRVNRELREAQAEIDQIEAYQLAEPEDSCVDIYNAMDLVRPGCINESMSFLRGFFEGHRMTSFMNELSAESCPPLDASMNDLLIAVLEWLSQDQIRMDMTARTAMMAGLIGAFPCPDTLSPDN